MAIRDGGFAGAGSGRLESPGQRPSANPGAGRTTGSAMGGYGADRTMGAGLLSGALDASLPSGAASMSAPASASMMGGAMKAASEYGPGTMVGTIGNLFGGMGTYGILDENTRIARQQALLGQAMALAEQGKTLDYTLAPNVRSSGFLDPSTSGVMAHWTGSAKTSIPSMGAGTGFGYGAVIDQSGNVSYTQPFNEQGQFPATWHAAGLNRQNFGIANVGINPNQAQLDAARALGSEWFGGNPNVTTHGYVAGDLADVRNLPAGNRRQPAEGRALAQAFAGGSVMAPTQVAAVPAVTPVSAPVAATPVAPVVPAQTVATPTLPPRSATPGLGQRLLASVLNMPAYSRGASTNAATLGQPTNPSGVANLATGLLASAAPAPAPAALAPVEGNRGEPFQYVPIELATASATPVGEVPEVDFSLAMPEWYQQWLQSNSGLLA